MDAVRTIDLMNIIHQKNMVEIVPSMDISYKQKMQSAIQNLLEINSDIPSLQMYLSFFPNLNLTGNLVEESTSVPFEFFNGVKQANIKLKEQLLSFIGRNASEKLRMPELTVKSNPLYFYNPEISIENLAIHLKSIAYRFGILYPCFLQKTIHSKSSPKHWELLPEDVYYLSLHTQKYREILQSFVKNPLILPIFQNCLERILPLLEMIHYLHLSKNLAEVHEIGIFLIHGIFYIWIGLVDNSNVYKTVTRTVRENVELERDENRLRNAVNSSLELDEVEEVDITAVNIEQHDEINQTLADLFLKMFSTLKTKEQVNAKEAIMMSYADIMREVDYSKDREKQRLKERFKKMPMDERKAENVLKKLHLGDFSVDMKKINKYGKAELLGDRDVEEEEIAIDIAEQEEEEFMEYENGDSNLENQGEVEEDYIDMNENAYDNYEPGGYDE